MIVSYAVQTIIRYTLKTLQTIEARAEPEVEKVVDFVSFTRRKYLGNSDLAEIFWQKSRYFLLMFGKHN